jgi:hypothetical protein
LYFSHFCLIFSFMWLFLGDFPSVPPTLQLQPRQPTTGGVDFLLPLQPKLLVPLGMFYHYY